MEPTSIEPFILITTEEGWEAALVYGEAVVSGKGKVPTNENIYKRLHALEAKK